MPIPVEDARAVSAVQRCAPGCGRVVELLNEKRATDAAAEFGVDSIPSAARGPLARKSIIEKRACRVIGRDRSDISIDAKVLRLQQGGVDFDPDYPCRRVECGAHSRYSKQRNICGSAVVPSLAEAAGEPDRGKVGQGNEPFRFIDDNEMIAPDLSIDDELRHGDSRSASHRAAAMAIEPPWPSRLRPLTGTGPQQGLVRRG